MRLKVFVMTVCCLLAWSSLGEEDYEKVQAARLAEIREKVTALKFSDGKLYSISDKQIAESTRATTPNIAGYPIFGEKKMGEKLREEILALLLKDETYGTVQAACFDPGMAVKFSDGSTEISVVICLHCRSLKWEMGGESTTLVLSQAGIVQLTILYRNHLAKFAK